MKFITETDSIAYAQLHEIFILRKQRSELLSPGIVDAIRKWSGGSEIAHINYGYQYGIIQGKRSERARACLKIAFRQMWVPVCGRLGPNEGGVVGYVDRIRAKYAAKWGVHLMGMNFQTRSRVCLKITSLWSLYPNQD